jgi:hypothetical protein
LGTGGAGSGGGGDSGGTASGESGGTGGADGLCELGTSDTAWATSCPTEPKTCTAGTWTAPPQGSNGHPLRAESEHFALYWFDSGATKPAPLEGLASPPSAQSVEAALDTLEELWDSYFSAPILFPEPYCGSPTKYKATVHLDDYYPLWGGGWGGDKMGLWVGVGALADDWGLAHEFMHGVQTTTQGFPDCGGSGCWIYESHANWMPHQVYRDEVHCSEMLANAPHLYYGSTRDRYCNWQFFEFLKDKHCHQAVSDMWAYQAPAGQRDPWQKLLLSQGWSIDQLNDLFGEWALHNVTWDYQDPDGHEQGATYRAAYGAASDDPGARTARRLRLTRLEPLDDDWPTTRRFAAPYAWAPQRWGYNVVELVPEAGAEEVRVSFRGVTQAGADSGWRYGLVATDAALTTARYSSLGAGSTGELALCVSPGERVFLVVTATPTSYQKIVWGSAGDGPAYPSLYRYPYLVELEGAWPSGFAGGALGACPSGTERHENGGGCAPASTPASVYVGPYARVLGGSVSGSARIEDHATIVNGTVSGGVVGGLTLLGVAAHPGHGAASFSVSGGEVRTVFYPLGWFGGGQSIGGSARVVGDVEFVATSKTSGNYFGMVTSDWSGAADLEEVTTAPPYSWPD